MKWIVYLKRNRVDEKVVRGDFSKVGVILIDVMDHQVPLDAEQTLWVPDLTLPTSDSRGQTALGKLIQKNPDVGGFLLKLIETAAKEMNEAAK